METQAITHACLLHGEGATRLLVDPWIQGTVFLGGWALEPPPLEDVLANLPSIDYVYLTHEHSDHTHPASLRRLFDGPAKGATLVLPRFMTDRFATFMAKVLPGVPILEMAHGKEYRFGELRAWSYQFRNDDSSLVLEGRDGYTCFNANDTYVKGLPLREILRAHPEPDLLVSQFSIANAYPYAYSDYLEHPDDFAWDRENVKQYCVEVLQVARPKAWVPYQSFVRFCRPENDFLNRWHVTLDEIEAFVAPKVAGRTKVVRLYPGDRLGGLELVRHPGGREHFYAQRTPQPAPERPTTREELLEAAKTFERDFRTSVSFPFRRKLRAHGFVAQPDATHLLFDPRESRFVVGGPELREEHPDYAWTTVSRPLLAEAFRLPWGMASLLISGCMMTQVPDEFRGPDFLFWAVGLVRHTGYFRLGTLWFLRPRAIGTAMRRWREAVDILIRAVRGGGFAKGNLMPKRNSAD